MAERYLKATGNWDAIASWSATDGGAAGASFPISTDNVHYTANSNGLALTVNVTSACLDMVADADNTATLVFGLGQNLYFYGNVAFAASMSTTIGGSTSMRAYSNGAQSITTAGVTINVQYFGVETSGCVLTMLDNLVLGAGNVNCFTKIGTTLNTGGFTVTCKTFDQSNTGARTLNLGASVINCTAWNYTGSDLILNGGTSSIRVTGTGAFAGGGETYYDVQLNGTAHTVSGDNTYTTLTRTGTATKTNTVTFTSGSVQTCTTFAMIGNSAINRLLVQSSTLGTAATITATNWTGADNFDLMDITATNAVDLSGVSSGDCGGNTNVTFTTAAAQISNAAGNWSTAATWGDGVGTDRVPLPQDDVSCSHNVTVDMPRIGKSITFTGTPTVSVSDNIEHYGSWINASGMTYTHNDKQNYFRGRDAFTLNSAGKTFRAVYLYAPSGTLTLVNDLSCVKHFGVIAGEFNDGGFNYTTTSGNGNDFVVEGALTRSIVKSGIWTLSGTLGGAKWNVSGSNYSLTDTGTIILTNSGVNAQTFAGGGLTYNHVRVEGAGAYTLTITGDNTFEKLRNDSSVAVKTILLTPTSTQTIRNLQVFSSAANVAVFNTGGAAATIKGHRGYCELNHVNLTSIVANEKYRYYAGNNSTDGTGNTNWLFTHKARHVE